MAEASAFRGVIDFFVEIGLYDVVLPFLLVFTMVFAILEKSKVFGTETIKDKEYPKKNLNAMAAFVIAFFVVASARLVEIITKVSAHAVVFLLALVLFMTLIGSFMKETKDGVFLDKGWRTGFMVAVLLGIILIFLNALNWLDAAYNFLKDNWSNEVVASVILLLTIAGAIVFIVSPSNEEKEE